MASPKKPALYKVVMIGESDVGKSSTFVRFKDGRFYEHLTSTIGLDSHTRSITFKDKSGTENKVQVCFCWKMMFSNLTVSITNSVLSATES